MSSDEQQKQHRKRMKRKEAVIDDAIERADGTKGLLLVLTGMGKGKSTSAFGMVARSLGHGLKVGVAQFVKGRLDTGEEAFFRSQPGVTWQVLGEGFTWKTQDLARDAASAQEGWKLVRTMLESDEYNLVVIDELTYPLKYGWLDTETILNDIQNRPQHQHVVVTGRGASPALCNAADTVSDVKLVKHAFRAGIKAQAGVDL